MRIVRVTVALLLVVLVGFALMLLGRRDARIEPFVDFSGSKGSFKEGVIEREVAEAELAQYGTELIPTLRAELHRGLWRRNKWWAWITNKLPKNTQDAVFKAEVEQDRRHERAALTLGRLRQQARSAIPDLEAVVAAGSHRSACAAEIALVMILSGNVTVQSNAVATLTASSQPRRYQFALHAYEIWPNQPELLSGPLCDSDESVRASALYALRSYGPRASNAVSVLVRMLADPSRTVRPRAALALGLVAPEYAETAVTVMLDHQRTNMSWTGDNAHVLYQALGPAAKAAVPTLQAELADPKWKMSHGDAAGALWRITGEVTPQIVEGLVTGTRIGVQRSQLRCLRILRQIGPPAAVAVPALHSLTNHPRALIRQLTRAALDSITRSPGQ